jgi:putative transposase
MGVQYGPTSHPTPFLHNSPMSGDGWPTRNLLPSTPPKHFGCPIRTRLCGRVGCPTSIPPPSLNQTPNSRYDKPVPTRLKRYQNSGAYHFITFSCYRRLPYLNDDHSRLIFETTFEQLRSRHQFYIFGYVLMPEHVHLLISEPKLNPLSVTLNVLKHETSQRLKGDRKQFWQRRYYDFNVLTHAKFVEKLRYIHRNPVIRGLVEKPEDWPWSSYRHWFTGELGRVEIESHWTFTRRRPRPSRPSPPPLQAPQCRPAGTGSPAAPPSTSAAAAAETPGPSRSA